MKKYVAEAIGTFALVFAGTGAIVVNDVSNEAITHVGIAITFGFVVMAMIYVIGDVSGAHINRNGFDGGQYIDGLVEAVLAPKVEEIDREIKARNKRDKEAFNVKTEKQNESFRNFVRMHRAYTRASDARSPAPNGHFLREFGQSDRELVENANDQASITQALSLLIGTIANALAHPYSVMRQELSKASNPAERLDTVFLTMLSRMPTAEERKLLQPIVQEEGVTGASRVIWTLMNTRQFLFVQ